MEGCISGMFLGASASRRHSGPKARILPRFPILRWRLFALRGTPTLPGERSLYHPG